MKNLLYIDKTERSIYKMKQVSKKYDIEIYEARNGQEAFNHLKIHKDIDIVLMDVNLENEDGFELVEQIRLDHPALPIVILTTLNSKKDFITGLKVGATDYLLKPFDEEKFIKRVLNPSKLRLSSSPGHIDTVDIRTLLHAELAKAQKGHYGITFGVAQYFNSKGESNLAIDDEYNNILNRFFPGLRSLFWDTDFVLRYGNQTFVFVLPFCPRSALPVILRKLHAFGHNFFMQNDLIHYSFISTFFSYPEDEEMDFEVIDRLIKQINHQRQKELSN